jgi:hypothetical protein
MAARNKYKGANLSGPTAAVHALTGDALGNTQRPPLVAEYAGLHTRAKSQTAEMRPYDRSKQALWAVMAADWRLHRCCYLGTTEPGLRPPKRSKKRMAGKAPADYAAERAEELCPARVQFLRTSASLANFADLLLYEDKRGIPTTTATATATTITTTTTTTTSST